MTELTATHLEALEARYNDDVAALRAAADAARSAVDGDASALRAFSGSDRLDASLLADIPMDELPPYIPPSHSPSEHALIPDTPLIDAPTSPSSLAFDDTPLWQN